MTNRQSTMCFPTSYRWSVHVTPNAVVTSEIKLKQNKRKTMFCFSENVLFQCFYM